MLTKASFLRDKIPHGNGNPEETAVLYNVACTYTHHGEIEHALDLLEKAVRNGFGHKEWIENDPDFTPLRSHPRFRSLIRSFSPAPSDSHP